MFIKKEFQSRYITDGTYVQVIKELIYAPYNVSLLLEKLNLQKPELCIDPIAYKDTLNKLFDELHCQKLFNNKNIINDGRLSFVLESTGGHRDNYTGNVNGREKLFLESKITVCDGKKQNETLLQTKNNFMDTSLPLGTLAYPLFSVYTNCSPITDLECHSLNNIVHISLKDQSNPCRTSVHQSNTEHHCYQQIYNKGCAVTFVPKETKNKNKLKKKRFI